jgi:putative transposase
MLGGMKTQNPDYRGYRFPPEIISYAVWLYHLFSLSFRDVEELLAERGVTVSYEAVHQWCLRFGQAFAKRLRGRQGRLGDAWHLDEVFVTISRERHYLWRAVDQDGEVLDILVQKRRNKHAAKRFFRKLLKGLQYVPHKLVTDKLTSYGVARREMIGSVTHCQGARQNNRAEVSHQPTRQRERQMRRFKSPRQAQRFLSAHGPINNLFRCGRHLTSAPHYRTFRARAFATWREVTCVQNAA